MQNLKDLILMASDRRPMLNVLFKWRNMSLISFNAGKSNNNKKERKKKSGICMIFLTYLMICKVSTWSDNLKMWVKIVWHCCDLEIYPRSLKAVWIGQIQRVVWSYTVWHLSHLFYPRKLQHKSFCCVWTFGQSAGQSITIITYIFIVCMGEFLWQKYEHGET